jgi:hypothetical protein
MEKKMINLNQFLEFEQTYFEFLNRVQSNFIRFKSKQSNEVVNEVVYWVAQLLFPTLRMLRKISYMAFDLVIFRIYRAEEFNETEIEIEEEIE